MSGGQKSRILKKRITAKQKAARRKNIAVARKYIKRKGTGDSYNISRAILFDKRVSVRGSSSRKASYKKAFKKSYKSNSGLSKLDRTIRAHEAGYKGATGRTRQLTSRIKWF